MDCLLDQIYPATTEALVAVRSAVRELCRRVRCSEECGEQVVLAVNEACMNIIQHGYHFSKGQHFTLCLGVDDDMLIAHLLDNGMPATDADLRPRDIDELRPGGLGVRFMRELMDDVSYQPAPDGFTNCLQLIKRIV